MAPRGPRTVESLVQDGVALIHQYLELDTKRTDVLRELAEVVVRLRLKFKTTEGQRDVAGRSAEYRAAITALYETAGIPADSQAGIQSALRYHIGNALRERVQETELETAGLMQAGPRERARRKTISLNHHLAADELDEEMADLVVIDLRDEYMAEVDPFEVLESMTHALKQTRAILTPMQGAFDLARLEREARRIEKELAGLHKLIAKAQALASAA